MSARCSDCQQDATQTLDGTSYCLAHYREQYNKRLLSEPTKTLFCRSGVPCQVTVAMQLLSQPVPLPPSVSILCMDVIARYLKPYA